MDPLAAANDWFDAYRAGDLDQIVACFANNATLECGCGQTAALTGKPAIRSYWKQRLLEYPACDLDDLAPCLNGAQVSYSSTDGRVLAYLSFGNDGLIRFLRCGPERI